MYHEIMNIVDIRVNAVLYLSNEVSKIKSRPHILEYSAKQVSVAIGGYAGTLGKVATEIAQDMSAMGIKCSYIRTSKPCKFVMNIDVE